jgi:hypothetical protein
MAAAAVQWDSVRPLRDVKEFQYSGAKFDKLASFKQWKIDVLRALRAFGLEKHIMVEKDKKKAEYLVDWAYEETIGAKEDDVRAMEDVYKALAKLEIRQPVKQEEERYHKRVGRWKEIR